MDMKTIMARVLVGALGTFIALQSLSFFGHMFKNINLYTQGWHGALMKGIVMGVIGLLIFLVGAWMVKAAIIHKEKKADDSEEEVSSQTAE
ncbi:hypothetical protein [Sulfurimonas sp.]|uniref:hypothetical protein n=1 Tax=Sulfurimonas sp. TaxID=2022749 RepID=UPI003D0FA1A8